MIEKIMPVCPFRKTTVIGKNSTTEYFADCRFELCPMYREDVMTVGFDGGDASVSHKTGRCVHPYATGPCDVRGYVLGVQTVESDGEEK